MTNADRASRALAAVAFYAPSAGSGGDDARGLQGGIVALLHDLLHLLDERHLEFSDLYEQAHDLYAHDYERERAAREALVGRAEGQE